MTQRPHRVAVLALPGVYPFELSIAARIFGCALGPAGGPLYRVVTCGVEAGHVPTFDGYSLVVGHDLGELRRADTIVVPPADFDGLSMATLERVGAALCNVSRGTRVASICAGADLLARVGLLDGRVATTHWRDAAGFRARHPGVRLDPDVLYVDDGDVLSSAGVASGIDLCLHMIRRDHGAEVANQVARLCVVPPYRDGGQAQYIDHPMPPPTQSSTGDTRAWALENLHASLTLAELAAHAAMSVRTFTRRFREEVGMSPNSWLIQQRLELARRLLETTDLSIDTIAERVGMGTAGSLRLRMGAAIGVSPSAYRRTFRTQHVA